MVCNRVLLYTVCLPNTPWHFNYVNFTSVPMQSLTQAYDYIYWENQSGYYPLIKYPGILCTSFDPLSSTQTGKSNFSVVLLGVNWQQPLFEVVYKKHMDFTDFYSHTYNDFCFLSIKSEKFAKKKEKEVKERRTKCLYHTVYYRTYRNVRFPRPRNAPTSIAWILLECKLLQDKTINESNTCNNKAKMQNTVSLQ